MSNKNIGLVFLTNEAGEDEGLGHAGIETYKDAPYASVARECGQNSSDAALAKPVAMTFDLLAIPVADYPLHAAQKTAIAQCLTKARFKKDVKEIEFFERASAVLSGATIPLLRISDRNTKGLIGPSVPGTPFHSLVKSSGVSNKDSEASGGSFGIGKNAAFAVSELQTVFYSTVYNDPTTQAKTFLAQGKTILVSHTDAEGQSKRATGYWGGPGFVPIGDPALVPAWLRRNEVGTSVVVAGFRESEHWQYRIAESLLQNFFCAICRDEIRFLVDEGCIDINKDTIAGLFSDPRIIKAADDADDREDFEFARSLYECLISESSVREHFDIKGLGPVSITLLIREGLQKRVRIVRNGMAITDELGSFGDKFASFPMYRDFVALVEPASSEGSGLIKRLENPRHDGLSAERLADAHKRAEASMAMKKLAKAIRQRIKEQALPKPAESVTLDELTEFFDYRDPADKPPSPTAEENPEVMTYAPANPNGPRATDESTGVAGAFGGRGRGTGREGKRPGSGGGRGSGTGGRGKKGGAASIDLADFRNVVVPASTGWSRRLYFTPEETGEASVTVLAAGMDVPTALHVIAADAAKVNNGKLVVNMTAGERHDIYLKFNEEYAGPIELVASKNASGVES